jgi:hypothetical protein
LEHKFNKNLIKQIIISLDLGLNRWLI